MNKSDQSELDQLRQKIITMQFSGDEASYKAFLKDNFQNEEGSHRDICELQWLRTRFPKHAAPVVGEFEQLF